MLLKEFRLFFTKELSLKYPKTEIDTFFFLLIEDFFGFERVDVVLKSDFLIPEKKVISLKLATKRLQNEEPIQYVLKKTEFFGLPFFVNEDTLIPRPETEELVAWILDEINLSKINKPTVHSEPLSILDIGTGTGCIAISLAKNLPKATFFALDISSKAIKIAKQNAKLNKVKINFIKADVLKMTQFIQSFDIIVSNPPYVRKSEKKEMKKNVLDNEPSLALFVDDENPLLFYEKITDLAIHHLTENGSLFFEINQYLSKKMIKMVRQKGFLKTELRKDSFKNDRMIKANIS